MNLHERSERSERREHVGSEPRDLFGQTLRTVGILVGACVLFVGALSVTAVVITNKAMGTSQQGQTTDSSSSQSAAPSKPGANRPHDAKPGQRSQSI